MKPIRSQEVADLAGVSRTTVSYVLNGRVDVSIPMATRAKVLQCAKELGYKTNLAARVLAMGNTGMISLLTVRTSIRQQSDVIRAIQSLLTRDGFEIIINRSFSGKPRLKEEDPVKPSLQTQWPVDGILTYNLSREVLSEENFQVPLVSLGSHGTLDHDFVSVDLYQGTLDAISHLQQLGRKKIGFLVNDYGQTLDPRARAYTEAMNLAGTPAIKIVASNATKHSAREAMSHFLTTHEAIDALFCFSDDMVIGAYKALRESGRRIPEDVALVGCDGIDDLEYFDTPITTVVQPVKRMCEIGWDFLRARIADPSIPPQQIMLPTELAIRASTAS